MRAIVKITFEGEFVENEVGAIILSDTIDHAKKMVLGATEICMSSSTFEVFNRILTKYQFKEDAENYQINRFKDLKIKVYHTIEPFTIEVR